MYNLFEKSLIVEKSENYFNFINQKQSSFYVYTNVSARIFGTC